MTQEALDFDQAEKNRLREAYERTPSIRNRYTFEQAISLKGLAIALRLYAEAIGREKQCRQ